MKSQRILMTIDEYLQMQHPFGYKVEYTKGEAIFQPRELFVDGCLALTPKDIKPRYTFQSARLIYQQAMKESFFTVFKDSIEFCDWPESAIRKHGEKNIDDYFAGVRGEPHPVSKILLDQSGKIIALALFVSTKKEEVKLDLLYVLSEFRRRGIATEMVSLAIDELSQQGIKEISSTWHALNQVSETWHHEFGFKDVYNQYYIWMKYSWSKREVQRLQKQGITQGLEKMQQQQNQWRALLEGEG